MRATRPSVADRVWVLVAVAGLFVVAMIAAGTQGVPVFDRRGPLWEQTPLASPTPPPPEVTPRAERPEATASEGAVAWLLVMIVAAVLTAWALYAIVRALVRLLRRRRVRVRAGGELSAEAVAPTVEPVEEMVHEGVVEALRVIEEHRFPRDAIIAAWVWLEDSAARTGVERGRSETPAEFTRRIVARRTAVAPDVAALLGLYERVRFGRYEADEHDRAAAHDALVRIEWEWQ
ncbi:DUF4129 domain-containing protein [Microbacterium sp.]|uniref:DUF4129 domain-containing protein n=1 Tax=Microbacterium sp. TaxID=51671 RepID=UPI0039E3A820